MTAFWWSISLFLLFPLLQPLTCEESGQHASQVKLEQMRYHLHFLPCLTSLHLEHFVESPEQSLMQLRMLGYLLLATAMFLVSTQHLWFCSWFTFVLLLHLKIRLSKLSYHCPNCYFLHHQSQPVLSCLLTRLLWQLIVFSLPRQQAQSSHFRLSFKVQLWLRQLPETQSSQALKLATEVQQQLG